jgi:hypothetical protein
MACTHGVAWRSVHGPHACVHRGCAPAISSSPGMTPPPTLLSSRRRDCSRGKAPGDATSMERTHAMLRSVITFTPHMRAHAAADSTCDAAPSRPWSRAPTCASTASRRGVQHARSARTSSPQRLLHSERTTTASHSAAPGAGGGGGCCVAAREVSRKQTLRDRRPPSVYAAMRQSVDPVRCSVFSPG